MEATNSSRSAIRTSLLSTVHGRDRRKLRRIQKQDLEAVRRYGKRVKQTVRVKGVPVTRWKFTYMDTVLITDETELIEVTSYVLPIVIPSAMVSSEDIALHTTLRETLKRKPDLYTSHTILIVDRSASMKTCDVDNFKERIHAVYGTIALDIIGNAIDNNQCRETDVLSLIEFSNTAKCVFEREPITNCLFNQILSRLERERPSNHGFFLEPLKEAMRLLLDDRLWPNAPIAVIFLSDGKPSEFNMKKMHPREFSEQLQFLMTQLVIPFKHRLSFTAIGFAGESTNFDTLKEMVGTAVSCGAVQSRYVYASGAGMNLSTALSSIVTQTQESRIQYDRNGTFVPRLMRQVAEETTLATYSIGEIADPALWTIYPIARNYRWEKSRSRTAWPWVQIDMASGKIAEGVAIRNKPFAKGAERIVYQLVEVKRRPLVSSVFQGSNPLRTTWEICSQMMCAKEPLFEDDEKEKLKFHAKFGLTQFRAQRLADKFTSRIISIFRRYKLNMEDFARIRFISSTVYEATSGQGNQHEIQGFLAEPLLNHSKYQKWNGNNGYVQSNLTSTQRAQVREANLKAMLEVVPEEDLDESEIEWDGSDDDEDFDDNEDTRARPTEVQIRIALSDYPQAFSHWSYRYTQRQALICDLQGVVELMNGCHTFLLTDPVIHSHSREHKRHQHGRTDHGLKGMMEFFKTHTCSELCRLLCLNGYVQPFV